MGPYGALWAHIWAHMGSYGSSWTGLGSSVNFPSTFRRDFWTNFACFGSKNGIFMKFLYDSASFLLEKLKKHVILIKNLNILTKNQKKFRKTLKNLRFLGIPRDP